MNPGTFQGAGTGVIQQSSGFRRQIFVPVSSTWYAPYSGYYNIFVCGAGGSGGGTGSGSVGAAAGGGSGGVVIKNGYFLRIGTRIVITAGAGGTGISTNTAISGNSGGATTVTGGGLSLYAGGGGGGGSSTSGLATGGTGGTASGGDLNFAGGRGGNATFGGSATLLAAAGGAAPSFWGADTRGGDAVASSFSAAGGGAGVGGRGGDATGSGATAAGASGSSYAAGGDSTSGGGNGNSTIWNNVFSPFAVQNAESGTSYWQQAGTFFNGDYLSPLGNATDGRVDGNTTITQVRVRGGAGSCGVVSTNASASDFSSYSCYHFGGSGGCVSLSTSGSHAIAGATYWGAGSGGASSRSANGYSGTGGNGFVIITWVQQ